MNRCAFLIAVVCLTLLSPRAALTDSIHTKRIAKPTLGLLQQLFLMTEALAILKASGDHNSSRAYLHSRPDRFKFLAARQQHPMTVDGYSVQDLASPIIGYTLFYHSSNGPLIIVDASVNPHHQLAMSKASELISHPFDSVSTPDGSTLYFLGTYDLDASQLIKIMVRKAGTPVRPDYAIRYAVSDR